MKSKKGDLLNQVTIQLILIGLVFVLFLVASVNRVNTRGVKQQILEKQTALLIDSAVRGMDFVLWKNYSNGIIQDVELDGGRVFIKVDGLRSAKGYPYFSRYIVHVEEEAERFVIKVR